MSRRDSKTGKFLKKPKEKSKFPDCFIMGRAREGVFKRAFLELKEFIKFLFDKRYR